MTKVKDIRGAQNPLDRLGRPLHDLRISVMDRCNFRCPYCMPREQFHEHYRFLKTTERLSFEEIARLARLFAQLGVKKLRLTGGEPLLRANLADLVGDLTSIPGIEDIALTTNGVLLAQHAVDLHAHGLKRVTVSLDTLDEAIFKQMSGGFAALSQVLGGIEAALDAPIDDLVTGSLRLHVMRAGRRSELEATARVRLAGSQRVLAIAVMSDGTTYAAGADVEVTIAGCLDAS